MSKNVGPKELVGAGLAVAVGIWAFGSYGGSGVMNGIGAIVIGLLILLVCVALPLALIYWVIRFLGRTNRLVKKKLDE